MQLRRRRRPGPHTIPVAEPSRWASPACTATSDEQRSAALADYAVRLAGRPDLIAAARAELAGTCVRLVDDQSLGSGNG